MAMARPFLVSPDLDADALLSDPLTVSELANLFGFSRKRMRPILDRMKGAERLGPRWRVPLVKMPPAYLIRVGLLAPVLTHKEAVELVDLLSVRDEMGRFEHAGRPPSSQSNG